MAEVPEIATRAQLLELARQTKEKLDGKAERKAGIFYIVGTGDTAGTWKANSDEITEYFDGLTILYKVPVAGVSGGTTLNINELGAVTVVRNASTAISTAFPVNSVVILTYTTDDGTPYWKVADYDSNTKTTTSTTNKVGTKLFLAGATTQGSGKTTYSNKYCYVGSDNRLYSYNTETGVSEAVLTVSDLDDYKTAYEYAQDGGYTGTEDEFAAKLAGSDVFVAEYGVTTFEEVVNAYANGTKIVYLQVDDVGYYASFYIVNAVVYFVAPTISGNKVITLSSLDNWSDAVTNAYGLFQSGSYTGTGVYGTSNLNSFTLDFAPRMVYVYFPATSTTYPFGINLYNMFFWFEGCTDTVSFVQGQVGSTTVKIYPTFDSATNTFSWYSTSADYQFNKANLTYYYIAIG